MLDGEILDPSRMNVVAAADHDVLQPSDDRQVAAVVEHAKVAGQEPAVAIERRLGGLLVVEVAEHQRRPAATDLTNRTDRPLRSEERRVGKECVRTCRFGCSPYL